MESTGNCWSVTSEHGDSSAEEVESPRSVVTAARSVRGRWRRCRNDQKKNSNAAYMHSQVLRIKEEELQIGEDFNGDQSNDDYAANAHPFDHRIVIWSREILPASPLGVIKNNRCH